MTKEKPIRVLSTSTGAHKIGAIEDALKYVFPGQAFEVVGVKLPSDIQAQPVGMTMTTRGADNRLRHALAQADDYDYVVSIMSGIIVKKVTPPKSYVDKAVVVVKNLKTKRRATEVSDPVPFPLNAVIEAHSRGFGTTTVGAVLAEQHPGWDSTDPHSFITKLKRSRRSLMAAAVAKALEKVK